MQDEINKVRWQHAEAEHDLLKKELMRARQMASSGFGPGGQALALTNPRKMYADKPEGFNPLSVVTRADKSLDPNARPPLRVLRSPFMNIASSILSALHVLGVQHVLVRSRRTHISAISPRL